MYKLTCISIKNTFQLLIDICSVLIACDSKLWLIATISLGDIFTK